MAKPKPNTPGPDPPRQVGLVALQAAAAEITTASVTIRTLRVNSRQLTQGTFRQLFTRKLIDEKTCTLLGTVWGHVNYLRDFDDQRQFVVQFGEELYRCPVRLRNLESRWQDQWPEPPGRQYGAYRELFHRRIYALAIEGNLELPERIQDCDGSFGPCDEFEETVFPWFEVTFNTQKQVLFYDAVRPQAKRDYDLGPGGSARWFELTADEVRQRARDELTKLLKSSNNEAHPSAWFTAEMERVEAEFVAYRTRWDAMMDRLRAVDQLFIAT